MRLGLRSDLPVQVRRNTEKMKIIKEFFESSSSPGTNPDYCSLLFIFAHSSVLTPQILKIVTIVTYQADDHDLVIARQSSLEAEIRQVLADGEEDKFIF